MIEKIDVSHLNSFAEIAALFDKPFATDTDIAIKIEGLTAEQIEEIFQGSSYTLSTGIPKK